MDRNGSVFLRTACKVADTRRSLFIDQLEAFVADLKATGMSEAAILQTQKSLDGEGLVKVRPTIASGLQVFEITSAGLERFFMNRFGVAGYHKILGDIARLKQEHLMRGIRVTSDSIAKELKVSTMLVHHVLTSR